MLLDDSDEVGSELQRDTVHPVVLADLPIAVVKVAEYPLDLPDRVHGVIELNLITLGGDALRQGGQFGLHLRGRGSV